VRQVGQQGQTVEEAEELAAAPPPTAAPEPTRKPGRKAWVFAALGILAIFACIIIMFMLFFKTDDITATVTGVQWQRSIVIEAYTTVTASDWLDEIPTDAEILGCSTRYRYTSNTPVINATEVCGEVYYEDTGTGAGEAVQDCVYEVYDDYCEYEALAWVQVDTLVASGNDLDPDWPWASLANNQREGARQESYTITFSGNGETYQYTTTDSRLFLQAQPGSQWDLSVNQLGGVQGIEPSN
jgi:hypothetical protein